MNPSTHNQPAMSSQDKAIAVLQLRRAGYSYSQISKSQAIKLSKTRVANIVTREMRRLDAKLLEEAKICRQLDLQRLDEMWIGIYPKAKAGDLHCIDRALKIIERRARIMGYEQLAPENMSDAEELKPFIVAVGEAPKEWKFAQLPDHKTIEGEPVQ